ncbi:MAG: hypothetical protein EBR30_00310 [Cytophagia bacterium]|nr:hypothetical protein [Cytophagia bacterium]
MVTLNYGHYNRLGNIMFIWAAAGIFCKKHNFKLNMPRTLPKFKNKPDDPEPVSTGFGELDSSIQIQYEFGTRCFEEPTIVVNNKNYLPLLRAEYIMDARYFFEDYFQLKEIITDYRNEIKQIYKCTFTERDSKEVFVAFRLGDATYSRARLPKEYYEDALTRLYDTGCNGGYITSENLEHPDVQYLINKFGLKPYINYTPLEKINFAKDFNNLVLSEGSFSFWIGMLSNAQNVYINDRRHIWSWHGDIFVVPEWKRLCYDSPHLPG